MSDSVRHLSPGMRSDVSRSTSSTPYHHYQNSATNSSNSSSSTTATSTAWIHRHPATAVPMTGPTPTALHGSLSSSFTSPNHHHHHHHGNNLDVHLSRLQEEQQHERLCKSQKSKLLQKNLESLRGLVQEIQADDWKYAKTNDGGDDNTADPFLAEQFTRMDAWGGNPEKKTT